MNPSLRVANGSTVCREHFLSRFVAIRCQSMGTTVECSAWHTPQIGQFGLGSSHHHFDVTRGCPSIDAMPWFSRGLANLARNSPLSDVLPTEGPPRCYMQDLTVHPGSPRQPSTGVVFERLHYNEALELVFVAPTKHPPAKNTRKKNVSEMLLQAPCLLSDRGQGAAQNPPHHRHSLGMGDHWHPRAGDQSPPSTHSSR